MQIGEIIRRYRKDKNMTQEEMANRLGVTAPAVNKWENGNSLPDIMLLAPIARLLEISLDTLLSYREELTEEEINALIQEMDDKLKGESYDVVFQWTKEKLEEYPNCEKLIWQAAVVLDAHRLTKDIPDKEQYGEYIKNCYIRALESKDETTRYSAADSLFEQCIRNEQYEEAKAYLEYFSMQNPERKIKQAVLYSKTGSLLEALKTYEEILFSGYQMMSSVFQRMYTLAMEKHDRERAHYLVEKQKQMSRLFEMGDYHEISSGLELAVVEQDIEETLKIMQGMLETVEDVCAFCHAPLYAHMAWKEIRPEFINGLKSSLRENFRDEETFGFLKEESRWKELMAE